VNIFSLPARRPAALLGATAVLTAGALVLTAPAAHATGGGSNGQATAATLRADLGVSLLNKAADVPLHVSLNEVHAPADANKTVLSAELKDVANGKAFSMLSADVATSKATANQKKATGYANLVNAQVHLPGLLLFPVIKVQQVTSTATCEAGKKPTAASNLLGDVVVLGKKITLSAAGSAKVTVPAVGEVQLELSKTGTTTSTAAASALKLDVTVQPLNLNVAKVTGEVVLVEATCQTAATSASTGGSNSAGGSTSGGGSGSNGGSTSAGSGSGGSGSGGSVSSGSSGTQTASSGNLAETGSSSSTPLLAAGAGALILAGGGALYMARRRKAAIPQG
jgi:LPXTG-motif cell wall-anchored protein